MQQGERPEVTQSYPPDRAVSNLRRARADEVRLIASAFTKLGAQTTAYKSLCKVLYEALHALAQDISSKARREGESRNTIMALEQRCKELESKMQEYSFMHDRAVKMNEEMTSMSGTLALAEGVANRSREEVERLQREVERLQEELSANRMEMSINEVSTSVFLTESYMSLQRENARLMEIIQNIQGTGVNIN